jgi:lipid II:glycine glycyltransferase (peptidoglycan interpeptide bridge formation enzyme)
MPLETRVASEDDRERYNAFVASSPQADVLQSWEWGEIKRPSGWAPRRYLVSDGDRVVAAASILRTRPAKAVPPLLYAPRGPVFADEAGLRAIVEAVRRDAGGAFVVKCDPPLEASAAEAKILTGAGFVDAGGTGFGGVQPKAVMILDITPDEDKIFEGLKSKWRYNVRLAERKGVSVAEAGRADLPAFYDVLTETARRDGFLVRGRSYFETLHDTLAPRGMLQLFLTRYEGSPIAGAILFTFGRRATYVYGASSNEHRNVMPNHLMQWEMMRWAKARGYEVYDFRGVSPVRAGVASEEHIAGLNRFKEGFGARYVEYVGELDLPLRPLWWRAWRAGSPAAMRLYKRLKGGASAAE